MANSWGRKLKEVGEKCQISHKVVEGATTCTGLLENRKITSLIDKANRDSAVPASYAWGRVCCFYKLANLWKLRKFT